MTPHFTSKYLKAADLQGKRVTVTIDRYDFKNVGSDEKPDKKIVLFFAGKEKGMVCNKTNANRIAAKFGEDLEDWRGKEIIIAAEMVEFQGDLVESIRVQVPSEHVEGDAPF